MNPTRRHPAGTRGGGGSSSSSTSSADVASAAAAAAVVVVVVVVVVDDDDDVDDDVEDDVVVVAVVVVAVVVVVVAVAVIVVVIVVVVAVNPTWRHPAGHEVVGLCGRLSVGVSTAQMAHHLRAATTTYIQRHCRYTLQWYKQNQVHKTNTKTVHK